MELVMSGAFQRGRVVAALQPCPIKRWTPMEFVNCGNHAFAMAVAKLLTTNLFCRYGVGQSCRSDGKVATSGHAVTGPAEWPCWVFHYYPPRRCDVRVIGMWRSRLLCHPCRPLFITVVRWWCKVSDEMIHHILTSGGTERKNELSTPSSFRVHVGPFASALALLSLCGMGRLARVFRVRGTAVLLEVQSVSTRCSICFYSKQTLFQLETCAGSNRITFYFQLKEHVLLQHSLLMKVE